MKMKGAVAQKPKMVDGVVQKPKKLKRVENAELAVQRYEEMYNELTKMREEFESQFPQAYSALSAIHQQEDEVREQIDACKILVREAKQSIGPFTCTLKYSTEGYDGARLLELIADLPAQEAGLLFKELHKRGLLASAKVDKAAAQVIRASDPSLRDRLSPAWDAGGESLTPAVSTPKV